VAGFSNLFTRRGGNFTKTDYRTTIYFKGEGDIDLLCGNFSSMLAIELEAKTFTGQMLFHCCKCGSINFHFNPA
jgi:hypothetical protein